MPGQQKEHKFDVTVANGKPLLSAHRISFEVQTPEMVIDSLAFMISDLKKSQPDFPLAIVALPKIGVKPPASDVGISARAVVVVSGNSQFATQRTRKLPEFGGLLAYSKEVTLKRLK